MTVIGETKLGGSLARCLRAGARGLLAALATAALSGLAVTASEAGGTMVAFHDPSPAGTIVVRTSERKLYLIIGSGQALRYTVGVGKAGAQWAGTSFISGKYLRPNWAPPASIKLERPTIPDLIKAGSPNNPMGAAAMTLSGGQYAIHGTNSPRSIGGFVSHGCIRMYNDDITELYARVAVGTRVVVAP